jgi:phosphatidylglycerophosphate synthase
VRSAISVNWPQRRKLETLTFSDWYFLKAAGVFALTMGIASGRVRAHHPFARFGPANQVTTARALLVALVAGFVGEPPSPFAAKATVILGSMATLLDGVDGWLARRTRMASAFGARFDEEVDALLILVLAILAWRWEKAGAWVLGSGILRHAFVASGWIWPWMRRPLAPTARARAICVIQVATLIAAIVPAVTYPASASIAALGLLALGYSFLADTLRLWRG